MFPHVTYPDMVNELAVTNKTIHEMQSAVEELPSDKAFREAMEDAAWKAANEAKDLWENEAKKKLKSTRDRYVKTLYIYESFGEGVVIGMDVGQDKLIDAVENGAPGFDMKRGLLGGRRTRRIFIKNPGNFKTVNNGMSDDQFMHPGWVGLHLTEEIEKELFNKILPKYLDEAFQAL